MRIPSLMGPVHENSIPKIPVEKKNPQVFLNDIWADFELLGQNGLGEVHCQNGWLYSGYDGNPAYHSHRYHPADRCLPKRLAVTMLKYGRIRMDLSAAFNSEEKGYPPVRARKLWRDL